MFFALPNALFPAIADIHGGAQELGLLYSAMAFGSLVVSIFSGWTGNIKTDGKAITICAALFGIAIIGFALSSNFYIALLFLAIAGAFDTISGIFRSSLWNTSIPTDKRGRLAGIELISYISGPKLGDLRTGFFAAAIGIPGALVCGGILCVVGVAWCAHKMPKFWNYDADKQHD